MALATLNFESQFLNGNTTVSIILPDKTRDVSPDAFYGSGQKYPVLWLLHGTFGDHSDWSTSRWSKSMPASRISSWLPQRAEQRLLLTGTSAPGGLWHVRLPHPGTHARRYSWFLCQTAARTTLSPACPWAAEERSSTLWPIRTSSRPRRCCPSARNYERILASPEAAQDKRLANRLRNYGGRENFLNSNEYLAHAR